MAINKKTSTIPYGPVGPILVSDTSNPDNLAITWYPDETYTPAIREAAESQGVTPQHLANDLMSWGISQGWGYAMPAGVTTVFLSKEDADVIREALGNPESITGSAIAKLIRVLCTSSKTPTIEPRKYKTLQELA